jgi:hypothetical protein
MPIQEATTVLFGKFLAPLFLLNDFKHATKKKPGYARQDIPSVLD